MALILVFCGGRTAAQEKTALRVPVHPRRNVEEFPPVEARFIRFTILRTTGQQPCLDEIEVYGPADPARNLALSSQGTRVTASGTLEGYRIHALAHVNDGLYGNGHSWISNTQDNGWVELEFPAPVLINRVIWSRDREGKFIDRLTVEYRVEAALEPGNWRLVASSADRSPLPVTPDVRGLPFGFVRNLSAVSNEVPGNDRPAAREYLLRTWQTADGLPSNTVTALRQTADGWLWIGTTNGLVRFDGRSFTTFGETLGLRNLNITCLLEDHHGTLWAGTAGGGLAYWRDGKIGMLPVGESLAGNTVLDLAEDADGTLWIATGEALQEYREGKLRVSRRGAVTRLAVGTDGLWLLSETVLRLWDGKDLVSAPAGLDPSSWSSISALAGGADGSLWFGGANGYVGCLADGTLTTYGEGHTALTSNTWELLAGGPEDVWLGTSASGLARLRGHDLLQLTTDDGLPSNSVRALCRDRDGNLWVGTAGGGLTRLRPRRVQALTTADGLSHNVIMALAQDAEGAIWIGTDGGGLNRWKDGKVEPRTPSYLLENQAISSLAIFGDSFLLGTSGNGLFRIGDGKVEQIREPDGLPGLLVTALCADSKGRLWVGSLDSGASCYSGGIITRPAEIESLAGVPVTCILEDHAGNVWFGTNGQGVTRLQPDGKLEHWTRAENLASDFIRTLCEDSTGAVWAGTNGGLTRWKSGKIFSFTSSQGLRDTVVSQILDDGTGDLWLGTNGGVLRVRQASFDEVASGRSDILDFLALGLEDGLPGLECTGGYDPAGLRTRDGQLFFGTVAGLAVINPADFASPSEPPVIVIESVISGGEIFPAPGKETIVLPAGTPRLGFEFTALALTAPDRVRFRYRMEGVEESWQEAGPERRAGYTHLPPGEYHFTLEGRADDGPWSEVPARVALRILAPWWRNPWMRVAGALLGITAVAGLARGVTRRRLQRRILEVERQFGLERERSRIARDIHDDLGASLTRISLLSALGQAQAHEPEKVSRQFSAIASTSGELVQAMDAIVWAVNPTQDTLESLARYLVRFAGDFFACSEVRLRLDVPAQLPQVDLSSEVRHNLFLACKEALNNALQHAAATEVSLRLAVEQDRLILEIRDDGRGFIADGKDAGNGLGNMTHRLAECGGTCEISTKPGRGTVVHFTVPLTPSL